MCYLGVFYLKFQYLFNYNLTEKARNLSVWSCITVFFQKLIWGPMNMMNHNPPKMAHFLRQRLLHVILYMMHVNYMYYTTKLNVYECNGTNIFIRLVEWYISSFGRMS